MKITLIVVGKTEEEYLKKGIDIYEKRLKHYLPFETLTIQALKNTKNINSEQQKQQEGSLILKGISSTDKLVLLDEAGKQISSVDLSVFVNLNALSSVKNLVFVIGGPYGFSQEVYKRANDTIALSKMTFSHQMVRLFYVEQLYRAMTILKGEPYHHS